jgi:hypothetical protein
LVPLRPRFHNRREADTEAGVPRRITGAGPDPCAAKLYSLLKCSLALNNGDPGQSLDEGGFPAGSVYGLLQLHRFHFDLLPILDARTAFANLSAMSF